MVICQLRSKIRVYNGDQQQLIAMTISSKLPWRFADGYHGDWQMVTMKPSSQYQGSQQCQLKLGGCRGDQQVVTMEISSTVSRQPCFQRTWEGAAGPWEGNHRRLYTAGCRRWTAGGRCTWNRKGRCVTSWTPRPRMRAEPRVLACA